MKIIIRNVNMRFLLQRGDNPFLGLSEFILEKYIIKILVGKVSITW